METLLITIHVLACFCIIGLVLLQPGQEGMGVIFGGSSSSFFGSSGAGGLLAKLTVLMAVVFFATSLGFTYIQTQQQSASQGSVVPEKQESRGQQAPGAASGQSGSQQGSGE